MTTTPLKLHARGVNVTAVLGPTNTGKTHLAIERMVAHESGMIGLPLRLLAGEVYTKICDKVGAEKVALITGEERIIPVEPSYYVCTVEAMPDSIEVEFVAIDEVQLAADFDRGHVFTDRILNRRGLSETLLLGASTAKNIIEKLIPNLNVISRPRLSELNYAGESKITRLPRRSAIVAFSAQEVYGIAELIRRQRGGTAVVLGALSPRTRNAQVALYQSGEVDFLVATDAIGMGLNLDIDHVAFAADRKFDGHQFRNLNPAELAQIAGRAGRHTQNGTFGVTGRVASFEAEMVQRLEAHEFEPIKMLQWRNTELDFRSLSSLKASLAKPAQEEGLTRALIASDESVLELLSRQADFTEQVDSEEKVALFWQVCQIPDYRKITPASHADLIRAIYSQISENGTISEDWFGNQVKDTDKAAADIDTLSNRIAQVRTWTYVANRSDWLDDPLHWQQKTREIEDRLSDALHECLAQKFVDRRTSILMRRLREDSQMEVDISETGEVKVEKHSVGTLRGFHFEPEMQTGGQEGKALRSAALKVLTNEYRERAERLSNAKDEAFSLSDEAQIIWENHPVANLEASQDHLQPHVRIIADDQLQAADRERVQNRLNEWLLAHLQTTIGSLLSLRTDNDLSSDAKGIAFRLSEEFGSIDRKSVHATIKSLDQSQRGKLRRYGVRFGAYAIYIPMLLKPASANVLRILWGLAKGGVNPKEFASLPLLSTQGYMSVPLEQGVSADYYKAIGYFVFGKRAVRIDMAERLGDTVRPLAQWRPGQPMTPVKQAPKKSAEEEKTTESVETADAEKASKTEMTAEVANTEKSSDDAKTLPDADSNASSSDQVTNDAAMSEKLDSASETEKTEVATDPQAKDQQEDRSAKDKKSDDTDTDVLPDHLRPPEGALGEGKFEINSQMMSLVGCSGEDFASILKAFGYRPAKIDVPAKTEADDKVSEVSDTSSAKSDGSDETAEAEAKAGEGETSSEAKTAEAKKTTDDEYVLPKVWCYSAPSKQNQHRRKKNFNAKGNEQSNNSKASKSGHRKNENQQNKFAKGNKKPGKSSKGSSGAKRNVKFDPDSPFSALAGLKQQLEKSQKEKAS